MRDLGQEEPTIPLANDRRAPDAKFLTRYIQRMFIENTLPKAVSFFHPDALSSAVGSRWTST